ncbi:nucleic acid-binding protein [Bacillus sp. AFS053548]|uniref:nucleic acid-binding protein n=1 Tax=Bacillus sp. AFS053548 TaxID=2033505 RepID=UPI000BFBE840|nr:nucleic acid-binding protein [Bacillus sp. AFS053548]PGM59544.1 nucleic acid-binding protein [Bacillus sp. AFS053548]
MRICNQCKTEMIENCNINIDSFNGFEIKISQKGKRFFNNISVSPKAAVCPNCGLVALYIDEFNKFRK